jgi:hypothetical protein
MIPEVVGLNPDDRRVPTALVLTAARAALPVAAEERQNVMALAILNAEGILADHDGRSPGELSKASRASLAAAPAAERWARIHLARMGFTPATMRPSSAAKIVALAVDGIARACISDPEDRLVKLLRDGIDVVKAFAPVEAEVPIFLPPWAVEAVSPVAADVSEEAARPVAL